MFKYKPLTGYTCVTHYTNGIIHIYTFVNPKNTLYVESRLWSSTGYSWNNYYKIVNNQNLKEPVWSQCIQPAIYKASQHGQYDTCLSPIIVFPLSQTKIAVKHQKDNIFRHNEDGSYTYGYEAADGTFKLETRFPDGSVQGRLLKGIVSQDFLPYFSSSKDSYLYQNDNCENVHT
jgi:hypothetical protein